MSTSLLAAVQDSTALKIGVKILNFSKSGKGKSHDFYKVAPRPLLVADADASADKFTDNRFGPFQRLGITTLGQLQQLLDELLVEGAKGNPPYASILIDSLTVLVDKTVSDLGIDVSDATAVNKGQSTFAREAKILNYKIRCLSNLGVHVFVTSEERTRYTEGKVNKDDAYAASSLSPQKFRFVFDFVYGKTERDEITADKSRFADWEEGKSYSGFDAVLHLTPMINGTARKVRGLEDFAAGSPTHEELMTLLRECKSVGKGGVIPNDAMLAYVAIAKDQEAEAAVVRKAINEIKKRYVVAVDAEVDAAA